MTPICWVYILSLPLISRYPVTTAPRSMVKYMFSIVFLLVLLGFSNPSDAQQPAGNFTLKGKVIDETTGKALEFATVALKKLRDSSLVSGTISNTTGDFKIMELPPGGYFVEIAFIGYEKYTSRVVFKPQVSSPVNDLGSVKLKPSALMLEGAEITADKNFVMNNIDRKTYDAQQLSVTTGGNVNDVLQNIPSVELDADGNISLRGNDNVTILIDGRPSGLTGAGGKSLLESLPASAVEKVEVLTNPSAKYDPDGISGIINIITKRNKLQGLTGNIGATTSFDKGYGANGSLNYRHGKINLYSNFGFNHNIRYSESESYRETYFTDYTEILDQDGEGEDVGTSFNIKLGADYNITEKSTISLSGIYNTSKGEEDEYTWYHIYGSPSNPDSLYRRDSYADEKDRGLDLEAMFKTWFSKPGRILTVAASSSMSLDNESNLYTQQGYLSREIPNPLTVVDMEEDDYDYTSDFYILSADYEHPLSETQHLEAGYKSTVRYMDNDYTSLYFDPASGTYLDDTTKTNRFLYDDGVHAVYAQYRHSLGKFGFQGGLRSEYAQVNSELKNTGESNSEEYFSLFPSVFVTWKPDQKWSMKATYSRRINRPRTNQLNPFTSYEDPLNIRTGNPELDPEYTDSYELEGGRIFDKISVTATIYYRYIHDYIQRYREFDPVSGIAEVTFQNANSSQNYGVELIVNGNLYKWWNFTASANFYQNKIDASNLEAELASSDIAWSGRVFTTVKMPLNSEFQLTYTYRAPFEGPQGRLKNMQMFSAALSKKVLKDKGQVTLRIANPFNTQRFGIEFENEVYYQDFTRVRDSRTVTLGFNWRFGELRDRSQRQREQQPREEMDMGF